MQKPIKQHTQQDKRRNGFLLIAIGFIVMLLGIALFMNLGFSDIFGIQPVTPEPVACGTLDIFCGIGNFFRPLVFYMSILIGGLGVAGGYLLGRTTTDSPELAISIGIFTGFISFILSNLYLPLAVILLILYIVALPPLASIVKPRLPRQLRGTSK